MDFLGLHMDFLGLHMDFSGLYNISMTDGLTDRRTDGPMDRHSLIDLNWCDLILIDPYWPFMTLIETLTDKKKASYSLIEMRDRI